MEQVRTITTTPGVLDRRIFLLSSLAAQPKTLPEFCERMNLFLHTWSGVGTDLLAKGYVRRTGEKRALPWRTTAHVLEVTALGMVELGGCGTTRVVSTTLMRCYQTRCDGEHHFFRRDHLA